MNLSDTFYVALCMTVLILGVVYWFWTQNQYIQRKLNLLENVVYEMRSELRHGGGGIPDPIEKVFEEAARAAATSGETYAPAPVEADAEVDDIDAVLESFSASNAVAATESMAPATQATQPTQATEANLFEVEDTIGTPINAGEFEDLVPGGISGIEGAEGAEDVSDVNNESVLNAMGLKELRELAKQKGVNGTKALRKHELVAAIRASKTSVTPFEIREGTLELN